MRSAGNRILAMLALLALLLAGCVGAPEPLPDPSVTGRVNSRPPATMVDATMPPTPPLDTDEAWLVAQHCEACHTLDRVAHTRLDWRGWRGEVGHMVQNGAELTVPEQQRIVDYLAWRW